MRSRDWLPALLLVAAIASPATASAAEGTTTIALRGAALDSLEAQGATLRAVRPARIVRRELRLPVRDGVVSSTATINLGGALRLRKGRRTLRIERLQARLGSTVRIAATIRGDRVTLFTAARRPSLNAAAGTASLRSAPLTLTRSAGRIIKRQLRLRRTPTGRAGAVTVDAIVTSPPSVQSPTGGTPLPGQPTQPQSGVIGDEPPRLARPASAVDVTGATVTWWVRDSWVRYISTGEGASPIAPAAAQPAVAGGQHACPDSPGTPTLVYAYAMPFASGWHDAATGRTALSTSGGVRFLYTAHGIDLEVRDLEIELSGASSRVIARFDGRLSTTPGNKRAVLVDLANAGPAPGGAPATVRGVLPAIGSLDVFAGFYPPQAGFGCVTVSYST